MDYEEYRSKPTEPIRIEAVQFTIADDQLPQDAYDAMIRLTEGHARVETLEDGTTILALHHSGDYYLDVDPGDYIIRNELGRFFQVPKAAFEKVYEPLNKPKRVRRTKTQIEADKVAGK